MRIDLIAVPWDSGSRGLRLGAGPLRLLDDGIAQHLESLGHEVRVEIVELESAFPTEVAGAFELARSIRDLVSEARRDGRLSIVLAGNCFAAAGIVAALAECSITWLDAHADLNTPETSRSGFLDGMALAVILGHGWHAMRRDLGLHPIPETAVRLVGVRDLDPPEREFIEKSPGMTELAAFPPASTGYLHVDLDVLDPSVGTANQFATPGGLSIDDVRRVIDRAAAAAPIAAAAITAYDPSYDSNGAVARAAFAIVEHIAAAAAARPHADPRLREIEQRMRAARAGLHRALTSIPRTRWTKQPGPSKWSIAQVLDHLHRVEAFIVRLLHQVPPAPESTADADVPWTLETRFMTDRRTRVDSPEQARPVGDPDPDDALHRIGEVRARTIDFMHTCDARALAAFRYPHFFIGELNGLQWLDFISGHERRHTAQIVEIAAALET